MFDTIETGALETIDTGALDSTLSRGHLSSRQFRDVSQLDRIAILSYLLRVCKHAGSEFVREPASGMRNRVAGNRFNNQRARERD